MGGGEVRELDRVDARRFGSDELGAVLRANVRACRIASTSK